MDGKILVVSAEGELRDEQLEQVSGGLNFARSACDGSVMPTDQKSAPGVVQPGQTHGIIAVLIGL